MRGMTHKEGVNVQIEGEDPPHFILQLPWINHGGMGADWIDYKCSLIVRLCINYTNGSARNA